LPSSFKKASLAASLLCGFLLVPASASPLGQGVGDADGPSLQSRIEDAAPGAVLRVQGGRHDGPIVIGKPLSLVGLDRPVIDGGRQGHVVLIRAPDVSLSGFLVRGSGADLGKDHAGVMVQADRARIEDTRIEDALHGIYLKKADDCLIVGNRIEGKSRAVETIGDVLRDGAIPLGDGLCSVPLDVNQRGNGIHLWNASGNRLEDNVVEGTRDGIYFSFSDRTSVRRNQVRRVRFGLHYMYSDENVFEGNRFADSAAGAAVMYSKGILASDNEFVGNQSRRGYGLLLQSVDDSAFLDNRIERNTIGVYLENANRNRLQSNAVAANYVGIRLTQSSAGNVFSRNRFLANLHPAETEAPSPANRWTLDGEGNYWSGAQVVDLDGDGRGELPHREADPLGRLRRPFPLAGLLSGSPALQLLRFVQARSPMPGVPAIEDPAPLARPPAN